MPDLQRLPNLDLKIKNKDPKKEETTKTDEDDELFNF